MSHDPPLVLLVDDQWDNRLLYVLTLKSAGFRVVEAANGEQALDQVFAEVPSVMVTDLGLPGIDGWELIRRLRADDRTRHLPIVALTGYVDCEDSGADLLLVKPCLPTVLRDRIRSLLMKGVESP